MWTYQLAAALFAGIVGTIVAMLVLTAPAKSTATADVIEAAWHRYEIGDLTDWEFARLMTPRPAMQPRYIFPAAGAMSKGEAAGAHDVAAD
jgi:hypothetical protein